MNDRYHGKISAVEAALGRVKSGQRVFVGSGAGEPQLLVDALAARAGELADTEVLHLLTLGAAPYSDRRFEGKLRHNALFIGANVREAVGQGLADYTPCFLSEIPQFFRSGRLPLDAALIQVTPPENGRCSLGTSVDIVKAAAETARYVVAQVNEKMPWTCGDSTVSVDDIDAFVPGSQEMLELPEPELTAVAVAISRYVAALVEDGATIQVGIGAVPNAIAAGLEGKRNLRVHSEMISDNLLGLIRRGALDARSKIVASFCLGTRRLYAAVDRNPLFEFRQTDYVNNPVVIARNDRMAAINGALQVDLTGQVAADSIGRRFYSGVGGQVDFVRGASMSRGGRSIIALPATALGGKVSRLVPALTEGTGVVTTRAEVDFVVTEYGIASLKAKTIRERAVALIEIAHPSFREELARAAAEAGLLEPGRILPPAAEPYHVELEVRRRFGDREVLFRPMKPSDERRLKELFYTQSPETTYHRYGMYLKRLSERQFQELAAIDYRKSLAIAGFVKDDGRERMIAVARYIALPDPRYAEAAFTVHDDFQGLGIGVFLVNYLSKVAKDRGLSGFQAEIVGLNPRMAHVLRRCYRKTREEDLGEDGLRITLRFRDWKEAEFSEERGSSVALRKG